MNFDKVRKSDSVSSSNSRELNDACIHMCVIVYIRTYSTYCTSVYVQYIYIHFNTCVHFKYAYVCPYVLKNTLTHTCIVYVVMLIWVSTVCTRLYYPTYVCMYVQWECLWRSAFIRNNVPYAVVFQLIQHLALCSHALYM